MAETVRLQRAVPTSEKFIVQLLYVRQVLHRTSAYVTKSAFYEGVGHLQRIFHREGGVTHQPLLVSED